MQMASFITTPAMTISIKELYTEEAIGFNNWVSSVLSNRRPKLPDMKAFIQYTCTNVYIYTPHISYQQTTYTRVHVHKNILHTSGAWSKSNSRNLISSCTNRELTNKISVVARHRHQSTTHGIGRQVRQAEICKLTGWCVAVNIMAKRKLTGKYLISRTHAAVLG